MSNYNKVILAGNLTRDPELRHTPKGTAIAKFGLAINRTWNGEDGQKREEVTFVDVDAFGKQADAIGKYLKKGKPVLVEGRLKLDQWDDKQTGQKRSRIGVVLESFAFLDGYTRDRQRDFEAHCVGWETVRLVESMLTKENILALAMRAHINSPVKSPFPTI